MQTTLCIILGVCLSLLVKSNKEANDYRELAKVFKLEYDNISRENAVLKRQIKRLEEINNISDC